GRSSVVVGLLASLLVGVGAGVGGYFIGRAQPSAAPVATAPSASPRATSPAPSSPDPLNLCRSALADLLSIEDELDSDLSTSASPTPGLLNPGDLAVLEVRVQAVPKVPALAEARALLAQAITR